MKKRILTSTLLVLTSFGAIADNPSFTYLDLGFSNWDPDRTSAYNGLEIKGSKQLTDNLYIAGDYNRVSRKSRDLSIATVGIGYLNTFSETTSFFAELDYAHIDSSTGSSDNGFEVTLGVRSMITPQFELKGAVEYLGKDSDGSTSAVLGAVYSFSESIAAYIDYKIESDINRAGIGVRFYF